MNNPVIYRLINKNDNKLVQYRNPAEIFTYLLGKRMSNYILVKSDDKGSRVIVPSLSLDYNSYTPEEFKEELMNK